MAYELREVLDTVRMTEMEHFDIRTVTLGVSLRDCSSLLPQTVRARVYDKIRRVAAHHVAVAEEVEALYGVQIANKRVSVTPITLIADSLSPSDFTGLAQILDTVAEDIGIDYLAGFSALVERGFTRGDEAYLEALPRALSTTSQLVTNRLEQIGQSRSRSGHEEALHRHAGHKRDVSLTRSLLARHDNAHRVVAGTCPLVGHNIC